VDASGLDMAELDRGLGRVLGFRYDEVTPDAVTLSFTVTDEHLQPFGLVHGGVHCAAVETAASVAAAVWYGDRGRVVGVSNSTDFFRAVRAGQLSARATPVHRGRTAQVWQVDVTDTADRLVARGQLRLANLPGAGSEGSERTGRG
jgi:1,4-dihydroxy-2-naphthoyl-CoA hydrolase